RYGTTDQTTKAPQTTPSTRSCTPRRRNPTERSWQRENGDFHSYSAGTDHGRLLQMRRPIPRRTTARTRRRQRHFWDTSYRWDGGSRCYSEGTQSRDSEDLHVGNTRQEQDWGTVCSKVRADQRTSHQRLLQTRRPALQRDDAGKSRPERNHHRRNRTNKIRL